MNIIEGNLLAKDRKIAIIVSRFNEFINNKLLEGARDCINRHEGNDELIDVYYVPGAFEIPYLLRKIVDKDKYDGIICLGTVIRGETPHFNYVASEVSKGIAKISMEGKLPVTYGILTTDTIEQAIERAGTKMGNKGWDAAISLLELMDLKEKI
ncbi:MAG: 6,7-dimethyl-8-ribityllumazine synthase [Candidatus Mcinerneyibacterium aminivorans]|jgi:6,7-dimethyl-8-ribityllumazine synthase|uniref:6,7-dimethyl-8-ribityllumazine synthase n=1 Tax=Candidatus Mcinerneyibacterium aminivorans TaxID=2703815 RepID=A0A5D0MFW5_9BACT|nr:MAG: 6,7-dimethyl-8-ribityllumazine synthase [Candidatus Mcinerneyibacterium aminivorans]